MKRFVTVGVVFCCCFLLPSDGVAFRASEDGSVSPSGERISESRSADPDGREIDLVESIQLSLSIHPELKAWRFELEKAEADRNIARSNFGPTLSVSYYHNELISEHSKGPTNEDYVDQNIDSTDLALVQPVFNGFGAVNDYKRSGLQRQRVEWKIKEIELQIVQKVQSEFLKLLQFQEEVRSLEGTVKRLESNSTATEAFHRVNMAPYVQVLQASVDLADAVQRLSQAKSSLRTQTVKLNVLLGLPPDATVLYAGRLDTGLLVFPWNMPDCLAYALANRPDLLATQLGRQIAEKDLAIVKGKYYPTIQMEAHLINRDNNYDEFGKTALGTAYDRDQENQYWQVGVNMRWNFFESGKTYYSHHKFRSEVNKQQETIRILEDDIHANVRAYYLTMQESWDRIDLTRKIIDAATENYQMAGKRFELHLAPNQEVLDAQDRLTRAEANRNQALADYKLSLANLYFAMGLRNDTLLPEGIGEKIPSPEPGVDISKDEN